MGERLSVECPSCLASVRVPTGPAGRRATCKTCGHRFPVEPDPGVFGLAQAEQASLQATRPSDLFDSREERRLHGREARRGPRHAFRWFLDDCPLWWLLLPGLPPAVGLLVASNALHPHRPGLAAAALALGAILLLFLTLTAFLRFLRAAVSLSREAGDYRRMHASGALGGEEARDEPEVSVSKSCTNCRKSVSPESKAGQRCPHCGAHWATEVWRRV